MRILAELYGLGPVEVAVLEFLLENDFSSVREISDALGIPSPDVSSALRRLERANLVVAHRPWGERLFRPRRNLIAHVLEAARRAISHKTVS